MPSSTFLTSSMKKKSLKGSSSINRRKELLTSSTPLHRRWLSIELSANNESRRHRKKRSHSRRRVLSYPMSLQNRVTEVEGAVAAVDVDLVGISPTKQRHLRLRRLSTSLKLPTHRSSRETPQSNESSMKMRVQLLTAKCSRTPDCKRDSSTRSMLLSSTWKTIFVTQKSGRCSRVD